LWIDLNENLKSETGWSAELGIKQGLKISDWKGFLDASVFTTEYQNMMEFTFGGPNPLTPFLGFASANIGDTRVSGFDITLAGEGKILGKNTQALIGYTYIDPIFLSWTKITRNSDSLPTTRPLTAGEVSYYGSASQNNVLKYRFRHSAKADVETRILPFLAIGLSWSFYTNTENVDNVFVGGLGNILAPHYGEYPSTNGTKVHNGYYNDHLGKGQSVLDMRVAWIPTKQARISFLCKNISNEEYMYRPALMESPRNYTLRFDLTF
jgi:outer membrane receptor protein involved in Fe transport